MDVYSYGLSPHFLFLPLSHHDYNSTPPTHKKIFYPSFRRFYRRYPHFRSYLNITSTFRIPFATHVYICCGSSHHARCGFDCLRRTGSGWLHGGHPKQKPYGLQHYRKGTRLDFLATGLQKAVLRGTVAGAPCVNWTNILLLVSVRSSGISVWLTWLLIGGEL